MAREKSTHGSHGPSAYGSAGPAKAFTKDTPRVLASDTNSDPETIAYRQEQLRANRERRRKAWENYDTIMKDPTHPKFFDATRDTLNRIEGMPTQKTELTGENGAPLMTGITVTFVKPPTENPARLPQKSSSTQTILCR